VFRNPTPDLVAPRGGYRPGVSRSDAPARPRALLVVVAAVGVEAAAMIGVVVLYLVELVLGRAADARGAVATTVLAVFVGAGLVLAARGLLAGRRWARAPILTWQLVQVLAVALPLLGGGGALPRAVGAALVVLGVVAGGGLFAPSVVAATTDQEAPPVV